MIFDGTGSTSMYNHEDVHKLPICIPTSNDSSAHDLRAVFSTAPGACTENVTSCAQVNGDISDLG